MVQLNDDVLHVIFDHLDAMFSPSDRSNLEQTANERRFTARAVCLVSCRLLPFGRRLLYNFVTSIGLEKMAERVHSRLRQPPPGAVLRTLALNEELGELVERWQHFEVPGSVEEDNILKNREAGPIAVLEWSEGGGEDNSSHLRRQVRALSKPSCALAGRLRILNLSIINSSEIPTIKLGKLLGAAVQLQVLALPSVALGGFPRSATGPPSLTALHVTEGDNRSFLPLVEATPTLKSLKLILNPALDPLSHGVRALNTPHPGLAALHLKSTVQRAGSTEDPAPTYRNINAFIACFPNLSILRLALIGDRMETTGVDLDKIPRGLEVAIIEFHAEDTGKQLSWDTATPTVAEVEAWIKRGGAPRLQKLILGRRGTLEGMKSLQDLCDERGVKLEYEVA